jgi:hypothetical protein
MGLDFVTSLLNFAAALLFLVPAAVAFLKKTRGYAVFLIQRPLTLCVASWPQGVLAEIGAANG